MLDRLSRDLSLTDAQKDRVGEILRKTSEKLEGRLRQMQPEIRKIFDDGFSEMRKRAHRWPKEQITRIERENGEARKAGSPLSLSGLPTGFHPLGGTSVTAVGF